MVKRYPDQGKEEFFSHTFDCFDGWEWCNGHSDSSRQIQFCQAGDWVSSSSLLLKYVFLQLPALMPLRALLQVLVSSCTTW